MKQNRGNQDRGTVAVVVALSATLIFALCALGVDLGAGFARKRDIQTQADLAALAAAAKLPADLVDDANNADIYAQATAYATKNEVGGQDTSLWDFSDDDATNGFIEFVGRNKLRLLAPKSHVNFVLAPAAGLPNGMDVSAVAAAEIRSPGKSLPFFVSTVCGWKAQTILDQTAGPSIPPTYVPTLSPTTSPAASASIDSISSSPSPVPAGASSVSITVTGSTGSTFNDVIGVGFTTEAGDHFSWPVSETGKSVTFTVPGVVLAKEAVWWVRLLEKGKKKDDPDLWSDSSNAKPFVVGSPEAADTPQCDSKKSGNFGSLDLSRSEGNPSTRLVENMAQGIEHGFDYFPPPYPVPPAGCAADPDAVMDAGSPVDGRLLNCLTTDTGSDLAKKATDALILGTAQGTPARLGATANPTTGNCGTTDRMMTDMPGSPKINNDVLSCFITDGSTVGDISKKSGAPTHALSEAVFQSPRFFWIPVLSADPSGGAGSYAIVDFRPVFITAQADGATKANPMVDPNNGIELAKNGKSVEKIKVRAINPASLPDFSPDLGDKTIDYLGVGYEDRAAR